MGKGVKEKIANARLRKEQREYVTKYSGMEAVTESYTVEQNGVKIVKTRTRYRKRRKNRK